ncbi:MAG TPA: SCO family protein [Rhodanobacteraceae bacterium]|jgi:protein SCO1/2|nr:SCO family protein [Rhodanobacteraceae bacterium]
MKQLAGLFLFLMAFALNAPAKAASADAPRSLPGDSVYQLDISLTNQDGRVSKLADLRGTPVLIAMFYTSCKYVCPMIIDSMLRVDKALTPEQRSELRVVLVSFDPSNDTPQALKAASELRHLDLTRWTLARTDAESVRKLAAALGVQYREISPGEFNHSAVISVLDKQGRNLAHSSRIGELDPDLLAATQRELAEH